MPRAYAVLHPLAARIVQAVNQDSGPFSSPTLTRRERDIYNALITLSEAAGDSYEAAGEIADYFNEIVAVEE